MISPLASRTASFRTEIFPRFWENANTRIRLPSHNCWATSTMSSEEPSEAIRTSSLSVG